MRMHHLGLVLGFATAAVAQSAAPSNITAFDSTNTTNTVVLAIADSAGDVAEFSLAPLSSAAVYTLPPVRSTGVVCMCLG